MPKKGGPPRRVVNRNLMNIHRRSSAQARERELKKHFLETCPDKAQAMRLKSQVDDLRIEDCKALTRTRGWVGDTLQKAERSPPDLVRAEVLFRESGYMCLDGLLTLAHARGGAEGMQAELVNIFNILGAAAEDIREQFEEARLDAEAAKKGGNDGESDERNEGTAETLEVAATVDGAHHRDEDGRRPPGPGDEGHLREDVDDAGGNHGPGGSPG